MFLLLALGCDLLLSANLLTSENPDFGYKKQTEIIIESTPIKRMFRLERSSGSRNLYETIPSFGEESIGDTMNTSMTEDVHNYLSRRVSIRNTEEHIDGSRKDAWKSLIKVHDWDEFV